MSLLFTVVKRLIFVFVIRITFLGMQQCEKGISEEDKKGHRRKYMTQLNATH